MINDVGMKPKLVGLFLLVGLLPLALVGWWSGRLGTDALMSKSFDHLESVREIKKAQISQWFEDRKADIAVLGTTATFYRDAAFEKLAAVQDLKKAQVEDYIDWVARDVLALSGRRGLQAFFENLAGYIEARGGNPMEPIALDDPEYRRRLGGYGDSLTEYAKNAGYPDLLLLRADYGHVLFSSASGGEMGTNLAIGPFRDESLARMWRRVVQTRKAVVEDFAERSGKNGAQAAFVGAPLWNARNEMVGVVALQLSAERLNAIVHRRQGMGRSGETYLIGKSQGRVFFSFRHDHDG